MAVANGQGARPQAAHAAEFALTCIGAGLDRTVAEMFLACDARLRNGRGVALAVAVVDVESGSLTIATVGTVCAVLLQDDKEHLFVSAGGIVGAGYDRLLPETMALAPGDVLVLFSNSVGKFLALQEQLKRSALSSRDQARVVLNRWANANEDAAVLIYRHEA